MKKAKVYLFVFILLILSSCSSDEYFIKTNDNLITAPDGTEYKFLAYEGSACVFGSTEFIGKIKGEKSSFYHLSMKIETGLYSCENDPERNILVRNVPDSEWKSFYRKASLPDIDLSPENCIRLELIKENAYEIDIKHMSCNEGITDSKEIAAFFADVRSQQTAEEANLYNLVKKPDGMLENCYKLGVVYGYFKDEPNLAVSFHVTSYDDKAYSISLDEPYEYVLPAKWIHELMNKN